MGSFALRWSSIFHLDRPKWSACAPGGWRRGEYWRLKRRIQGASPSSVRISMPIPRTPGPCPRNCWHFTWKSQAWGGLRCTPRRRRSSRCRKWENCRPGSARSSSGDWTTPSLVIDHVGLARSDALIIIKMQKVPACLSSGPASPARQRRHPVPLSDLRSRRYVFQSQKELVELPE